MVREEGGKLFNQRRVYSREGRECDSPVGFVGARLRSAPMTKNGHYRKNTETKQGGTTPRTTFRRVKSYQCDLSNLGKQGLFPNDQDLVVIGKPVKAVVYADNQEEEQVCVRNANITPSSMKKSRSAASLVSLDKNNHKQHNKSCQNAATGFFSLQPGSFVAYNSLQQQQQQQQQQQCQHQQEQVEGLHFRGDSVMTLSTGGFRGSWNSLHDSISSEFSRDTTASPAPSVYIDPSELVGKDAQVFNPDAPLKPRETLRGYKLGKTLGKGGFCTVLEGFHKLSGRPVAVKVIEKGAIVNGADRKRINFEVSVLKKLHHENVIKLYEVVERNHQMYLVMEHCPNGSLLEYIKTKRQLKEDEAAKLIIQIVDGLQHSHSCGIVHRDVKLENLLFCDDHNKLKLIDFGLSGEFVEGRKLTVSCGSPSYAAPEIHRRQAYNATPVDVWSTGVVLYAMLFGMLPFRDANKSRLSQKIISGKFVIPDNISSAGKDLLSRMLTVDPSKRITLDQVLQHPWIVPHLHPNKKQSLLQRDPSSGLVAPYDVVIDVMKQYGHDTELVKKELASQVCSGGTAAYYLLSLNLQDRYKVVYGNNNPNTHIQINFNKFIEQGDKQQNNTPRSLVLYNDAVQNISVNQCVPTQAW